MIHPRLLSVVLLICVPVLASAQRTRGSTRENWDRLEPGGRGPATSPLSRRDVEEIEPIGHLIARRKPLKLTDDQLARLKALESTAKGRDEPLLRAVDSLKGELRPDGQVNDEVWLRMQATREELMRVIAALRVNYTASASEALPLLDEAQRAAAEALLQKQTAEADAMLQEKLGGGRPSGGRRPGPGGPPGGRPSGRPPT